MPKLVELNYNTDDETLLHFDADRLAPVVNAAFEAIRAEAARQNPDDPDAITKPLCGGCSVVFFGALLDKFVEHAECGLQVSIDFDKAICERIMEGSEYRVIQSLFGRKANG